MKKTALIPLLTLLVSFFLLPGRQAFSFKYEGPYGINNWQWPLNLCEYFNQAHINRYRVMVDWARFEKTKGNVDFSTELWMTASVESATKLGAKLSLCIFNSPTWARTNKLKMLSYSPADYAEFAVKCIDYCEKKSTGIVEAIEVENEEPTNSYTDKIPLTCGTDQRDPSWYYAGILKAASKAVKEYNEKNNKNILVVTDGIWDGAFHHLDDLYQAGCKGCFDRINLHYYLKEQRPTDKDRPEDPADTGSVWNFITNIRYLKYIAEQNGDKNTNLWLTEFGWRFDPKEFPDFEQRRAKYIQYVFDACRKSGFTDRAQIYVGATNYDKMSLIYIDSTINPSYVEAFPTSFKTTPLFDMYVEYGAKYPVWTNKDVEPIEGVPAASKDAVILNADFELGKTKGWMNVKLDKNMSHSGKFSGWQEIPGSFETKFFTVESEKLYEVVYWLKIESENQETASITPVIAYWSQDTGEGSWIPPNYSGIVDTRNYTGGWRRIRFPFIPPKGINEVGVRVNADGTGKIWIDDLSVKALKMSAPIIPE